MRRFQVNVIDLVFFMICTLVASWYMLPFAKEKIAPAYIVFLGLILLANVVIKKEISVHDTVILIVAEVVMGVVYFLFTYSMDLNKATGIMTQLFVSLLPGILFCYIRRKRRIFKPFLITIILMFIFVFGKTFLEMLVNPNIARELAHVDQVGQSILTTYRLQNIGGFGHSYGTAFLAGTFFWMFTDKTRKHRVLYLALFVFASVYVFLTQYFMALFVILVLSVMCLYSNTKDIRYKVAYIMVGLLVLFLLPSILYYLATMTDGSTSAKFREVADSLTSMSVVGSASSARADVYKLSIKQFLKNPIIGHPGSNIAYSIIGGHATILDLLALNGIIGFIAYMTILKFLKKQINLQRTFYRSIYIVYIGLGCFNPTMNMYELSGFVFLFIPLIIYARRHTKEGGFLTDMKGGSV